MSEKRVAGFFRTGSVGKVLEKKVPIGKQRSKRGGVLVSCASGGGNETREVAGGIGRRTQRHKKLTQYIGSADRAGEPWGGSGYKAQVPGPAIKKLPMPVQKKTTGKKGRGKRKENKRVRMGNASVDKRT